MQHHGHVLGRGQERQQARVARTFQIVRPFPALTVEDNVVIGAILHRTDMEAARRHARDVLATLDLHDKRDIVASSLTLPDRKRLELARALATDPKLLLLDEVMAGLRPTETDRMVDILRRINREMGTTILLIEHVMRAVMALAGHMLVLHHGAPIAQGKPEEVVRDATFHDDRSTIQQLVAAGVAVIDDNRSALMHNKFMILDGQTVITGSWNYTINDTYRNNNNALIIRARPLVANYQAEFNEMFVDRQFGPRSPQNTPNVQFTQDGVTIETLFAPEDDVILAIDRALNGATHSIEFMAFSFTQDDMGQIMIDRARAGVNVRGIFERTGSETQFSQMRSLFCGARLDVRQDGNSFALHHKVIIIDAATVISGSFNFSVNATRSNDENLVIIRDPSLAAQYQQEFARRFTQAQRPGIAC